MRGGGGARRLSFSLPPTALESKIKPAFSTFPRLFFFFYYRVIAIKNIMLQSNTIIYNCVGLKYLKSIMDTLAVFREVHLSFFSITLLLYTIQSNVNQGLNFNISYHLIHCGIHADSTFSVSQVL